MVGKVGWLFCWGFFFTCPCFFFEGKRTLEEAEDAMLDLYVQRAGIEDGMSVLELGCGWGSLSLYLAEASPVNPMYEKT